MIAVVAGNRLNPGIRASLRTKPARAELVEACDVEVRDAQVSAASSDIVWLCPSTGSGGTVFLAVISNPTLLSPIARNAR